MVALVLAALLTFTEAYKREEFLYETDGGGKKLLVTFFFWLAFGYGLAIFGNCYIDSGKSIVSHAQITDMYKSHGKSGTYYHIRLTAWRYGHEGEGFTINKDLFYRLHTGQTLDIYVMPGRLNSPWYYFSDGED